MEAVMGEAFVILILGACGVFVLWGACEIWELGFTLVWVAAVLVVLAAVIVPFLDIMPDYSYGQRAGRVVKLSQKGIIWRTWEASLQVGSGANQETWSFSILDTRFVELLETALLDGSQVVVSYQQAVHRSVTKAKTSYAITRLELVR
jgi:hypothetical protein